MGHLFVDWKRLEGLFEYLRKWFKGLGGVFSHHSFISVPRSVCKTLYWGQPSLRTQKHTLLGDGSIGPVEVLKGMVKGLIKIEYACCNLVNDVMTICQSVKEF